jgi:HAD superfamily hydrolase (TIGR01662 family)
MHIVLITGFPASGKSSQVKALVDQGYMNLNRDEIGGSIDNLHSYADGYMSHGMKLVLDNTYGTKESRASIIKIAKSHGYKIECWVMSTSIEDAQVNAITRQIQRYGKLFMPEDFKGIKDPNMFPPAALFTYKKSYEKPTLSEGFDSIVDIKFKRNPSVYKNKALILDYDGTLRETISGEKFPTKPSDVRILPGRIEKLKEYQAKGYNLLGISNQSGVSKGKLSQQDAIDCFNKTNELLGLFIEVHFCPHSVPPIVCYCRKPMPGLGIMLVEKYKLNPADTIYVGDMTTDKTFAARCGFKFINQDEFFKM